MWRLLSRQSSEPHILLYYLMVIFSWASTTHGQFQLWHIDGDCEEPGPVPNSIRTVTGDHITYTCRNGFDSMSQSTVTNIYCIQNTKSYDRDLPTCDVTCGIQPQWPSVSVIDMEGTSPGDKVTFSCMNNGVERTWDGVCTYEGWDIEYPQCIGEVSLSQWTNRLFFDGVELYNGICTWFLMEGMDPWMSVTLSWNTEVYDVKRVEATLSPDTDNSWVSNFNITFYRHGVEIDSVNFQQEDTPADVYYEADTFHYGVSEVRIQAWGQTNIGGCLLQVYGQAHAGVCPTIFVPFDVQVQSSTSSLAYLDCIPGYSAYIGGVKTMECLYNLTWVSTGAVGIECTGRPNLSEDAVITTGVNRGLVQVSVELSKPALVERILIEMASGYSVDTVEVSYDNPTGSITVTSCPEDPDYGYAESHVYFCRDYPPAHRVEFTVRTRSNSHSSCQMALQEIKHLFILGSIIESGVLECYQSDNGQDYRGTLSFGVNGLPCLAWYVADPSLGNGDFPDVTVKDASNYCRNPKGESTRPFCHTMQGKTDCLVAQCSDVCSLTADGSDYEGTIKGFGVHCRFWTGDDVPYFRDSDFPDDSRSSTRKFCRNPGRLQTQPWCYRKTPSVDLKVNVCHVPQCPTSDNLLIVTMTWDEADYYLNHDHNVTWHECYVYKDGDDIEDRQDSRLREMCEADGSVLVTCASMRDGQLEWVTGFLVCRESSTTTLQISPSTVAAGRDVTTQQEQLITQSSEFLATFLGLFSWESLTSTPQIPLSTVASGPDVTTQGEQFTPSSEFLARSLDLTQTATYSMTAQTQIATVSIYSFTRESSGEYNNLASSSVPETEIETFTLGTNQLAFSSDTIAISSARVVRSEAQITASTESNIFQSSALHVETALGNQTNTIANTQLESQDFIVTTTLNQQTTLSPSQQPFTDFSAPTPSPIWQTDITAALISTTLELTSTAGTATTTSTIEPSTTILGTTTSNSTVPSAGTAPQLPVLDTLTNWGTTPGQCPCRCSSKSASNVTDDDIVAIKKAIHEELRVDTRKLSARTRRNTCAQDDRPEAVASGLFTVVFMTSVIGVIVVYDVIRVFGLIANFLQRFGFEFL